MHPFIAHFKVKIPVRSINSFELDRVFNSYYEKEKSIQVTAEVLRRLKTVNINFSEWIQAFTLAKNVMENKTTSKKCENFFRLILNDATGISQPIKSIINI